MKKKPLADVRSINGALASMSGFRAVEYEETVDAALEKLQRYHVTDEAHLPCNLEYCFVVRERLPIVSALLFSRGDKKLNAIFQEVPVGSDGCTWMLCVDANLSGVKSIFLVGKFHEDAWQDALDYLKDTMIKKSEDNLHTPAVIGNDRAGFLYLAFQLCNFFKPALKEVYE